MNNFTFPGSFLPGDDSTPEATSTPKGLAARMARATFSGVSPPARSHGFRRAPGPSRIRDPREPIPELPPRQFPARPAVGPRAAGVEQERLARIREERGKVRGAIRVDRLHPPERDAGGVPGRLVPVKLNPADPETPAQRHDRLRGLVHEHPDDLRPIRHRPHDLPGQRRVDAPRRPREKVDSDRLRPARDGVRGVLRTGHPADLDAEHPGSASRRPWAGGEAPPRSSPSGSRNPSAAR